MIFGVPTYRTLLYGVLALLFTSLGGFYEASGQPTLNFKRVINNWPTIELYFSVGCNGQPSYFTDKQFFKVFENGVEIKEFELWCPDPTMRCAISVSLVFDASGSMSGAGNAGAKAAGKFFVEQMDGLVDEAAILWFNSMVTVALGMSTNKNFLKSTIDMLPASGMTAVWDAIYAGVNELIANGMNQCRAVIVLTDGMDNSSSRTPAEIISLANRNRIRVFTIGLGGPINTAQLQAIAEMTGGRFYQTPNPAQLTAIYEEISTIILKGFQECLITYQSKCRDGSTRVVDLMLVNFCGGSDTKTKTYKTVLDSADFQPLEIRLGKKVARGDTEVRIPLELVDFIAEELFYASTFTILFDESCVQFQSIATPPGNLLRGVPITITPIPGGVVFETKENKLINGNGTLAELTFKTSDPSGKDTVCCNINLASWIFTAGCFKPVLEDGEICIVPRQPKVTCDIMAPNELTWMRVLKDYNPNPFTVSILLSNSGDREAKNVRFKILYDKKDIILVAPVNDVQSGTPRDLQPAGISEARWDVLAKRKIVGDSVIIIIVASFDNHEDLPCTTKVWVPPADAVLGCSVEAPTIVADNVNLRYVPMPFSVTVTAWNEGGKKTDTVFARIVVPPDLRLAGSDAPDKFTKKISPAVLNPGQHGTVDWQLWHPITLTSKEYTVGVWIKTSNADSTFCSLNILIPPLQAPILSPRCYTPDSLSFNEALDTYIPNPFQVTLTCVNVGGLPASNVTGFIYLPSNVEIVNPAIDPQRQAFLPIIMDKYQGGTVPQVNWTLRYTKRLRYDTYLRFKFVVGGMGPTGMPTDSIETWCEIRVPGLMPSFACDIKMPDSLGLNTEETGVEPNPFEVVYRVWNTSAQTAKIILVDIYYPPSDGLTLDVSTPKTRKPDLTIAPGDTATFKWIVYAQNRIDRRLPLIRVIAYDDEGNPVPCQDYLSIANLKTALICDAKTSESVIKYIPVLQEHAPMNWIITADLINTGGAALSDAVAEIEHSDPSGLNLVDFDPGFPDNSNPKTIPVIFPGQSKTVQWGYRLANQNTSGESKYVFFNIKYKSKETPEIISGCEIGIEIEPVVTPKLECEIIGPDTIRFSVNRYTPSPFDLKLKIRNVGNGDAYNVKAYLLQDTRFTILPPSYREFGTIDSGSVIDFDDNEGFTLKVTPRQDDGYDTVRVVVVADGIPSTFCEYRIFVMRELRPVFQMHCTAIPDRLTFDDQANDYVPNPFEVVTRAINVGDVKAEGCQLVFIGPSLFTPFDDKSIIKIPNGGTMQVGDTAEYVWKISPLKRLVSGWDTLHFQIQGRGGLGDRIVVSECLVPVYVPAARIAEYQMFCSAPEKLVFDNASGSYVPDPFEFKATVTNTGEADGFDLEISAILPPGLIFAAGESASKSIGSLVTGQSVEVIWLVRPIAVTQAPGQTLQLCAEAKDRLGQEGRCCANVFIPQATQAALSLTCNSEIDTLKVDRQRGEYENNPFKVFVQVTNNGDRPAYNVSVIVLPQSNELRILGDPERFVAKRLDQNVTSDTVSWNLYAIPRTESGVVEVRFIVVADGLPSRECVKMIYIPVVGRPMLDCYVTTSMVSTDDTLFFDFNIGDYVDDDNTMSVTGKYHVFKITTRVWNVGSAMVKRLRATILPPEGVALDEAESAIKEVGDLTIQKDAVVSWKIKPIRQFTDASRAFTILLTSDNTDSYTCTKNIVIKGAPKVSTVTLPQDPVGRYGDKIRVPIFIDPTIGRDVYIYKLNVRFDPTAVRFIEATNVGSLTERGWNGPKAEAYIEKGSTIPAIVRVEDYTTGTPLHSPEEGVLVTLAFRAIFGGSGQDQTKVLASELSFARSFIAIDPVTGYERLLVSSINSTEDYNAGKDVQVLFRNGMITVSGDCVIPLTYTGQYNLSQNVPNPFNSSTTIAYEIPEETEVTIRVFDALGREVATIVKSRQKAGIHLTHFNAENLPSGTYMYRMEAKEYSKMLRMVLMK